MHWVPDGRFPVEIVKRIVVPSVGFIAEVQGTASSRFSCRFSQDGCEEDAQEWPEEEFWIAVVYFGLVQRR